ncbi:hypothetical protein M231_06451 [Tremella mesenterica]|uniref:Ig-like domain-containing protein n=1 Tax=Tremella mesenterica TaxID=5217 RepID=A0A4Q1BF72_TREME|nr:hypothetical protein M231_06451 [Tremella mesenterica]
MWLFGLQSILFILPYLPLLLAQSSSVTATPSASGTPNLVVFSAPTLGVCSPGKFTWSLNNEDASKYQITLRAINVGIDQSIPPAPSSTLTSTTSSTSSSSLGTSTTSSRSASATTTAALAKLVNRASVIGDTNKTLHIGPANVAWSFEALPVEAGRWYIAGYVNDSAGTIGKTGIFSVINNGSTSCLLAVTTPIPSSGSPISSNPTISHTTSSIAVVPIGAASQSESKGLSGGAIGGIVAGVILGLLALSLLGCFFIRRRRRNRRKSQGDSIEPFRTMSESQVRVPPTNLGMGRSNKSPPRLSGSQPIALGDMKSDSEHSYSSRKSIGELEESEGSLSNSPPTEAVLSQLGPSHVQNDHNQPDSMGRNSRSGSGPVFDSGSGRGVGSSLGSELGMGIGQRIGDPFATAPSTPRLRDPFGSPSLDPQLDRRRSSGPPVVQGRNEGLKGMEVLRGRQDVRRPSTGVGEGKVGVPMVRTSSTRRKPVPSLGPELRELDREMQERRRRASEDQVKVATLGKSFTLQPDLPLHR